MKIWKLILATVEWLGNRTLEAIAFFYHDKWSALMLSCCIAVALLLNHYVILPTLSWVQSDPHAWRRVAGVIALVVIAFGSGQFIGWGGSEIRKRYLPPVRAKEKA